MDDKNGALEKLKAAMDEAERVDMSSVKIGDIIYVPLDEEDGLIYNPQNEMFRHFRTKCSISQNETYLRESFSLPINQIKKHRKNLLLRCFFIA